MLKPANDEQTTYGKLLAYSNAYMYKKCWVRYKEWNATFVLIYLVDQKIDVGFEIIYTIINMH